MKILSVALLGVTSVWAHTAHAVEVTGGSIGLSYSAFIDDTSVSRIGLEGSVELGFNRNFSTQVDVGYNDFNTTGLSTTTLGFHGIYHVSETTSLGAFYVFENASGQGDTDLLGLEGGFEAGQFEVEGYAARLDSDGGSDADIVGILARYEFGNALGVSGSYDLIDTDTTNLSKLAIRLDRDVSPSVNLFVEAGSSRVEAAGLTGSEPFVGLGAKFVFGAERGTTFNQRGFTRLLPGL